MPISKVRTLILARSDSLLNKNFKMRQNDEDETCPLCDEGPFNLEHLVDSCTYVNSKYNDTGCRYNELFECGDLKLWSAREEKINFVSKCLYLVPD